MGFFDGLIKDAVRDATRDVVDDAVRVATKDVIKDATGVDVDQVDNSSTVPQTSTTGEGGHTAGYFKEILTSEFADYELREKVSPSELGGDGRPYDFVLVKGGKIVAVIPLAEHNRTSNSAWKNARTAAESAKVPFINFHLHMPNKRDFVIDRIKRLLG